MYDWCLCRWEEAQMRDRLFGRGCNDWSQWWLVFHQGAGKRALEKCVALPETDMETGGTAIWMIVYFPLSHKLVTKRFLTLALIHMYLKRNNPHKKVVGPVNIQSPNMCSKSWLRRRNQHVSIIKAPTLLPKQTLAGRLQWLHTWFCEIIYIHISVYVAYTIYVGTHSGHTTAWKAHLDAELSHHLRCGRLRAGQHPDCMWTVLMLCQLFCF